MPGTKLEVIIVTLFKRNGNQPVSGMFNRSRSPSLPERFSNDQRKSPGFQDLRRGEESAPMIIVRITMKVLPEKQKEVMQTLLSLIEPVGKEKGCLSYDVFLLFRKYLHCDPDNDHRGILLSTTQVLKARTVSLVI